MEIVTKKEEKQSTLLAAGIRMCRSFQQWIDREELKSYDWWDIWSCRYGLWAKKLYYKNKLAGAPAVLPMIVMDIFWPSFRRFFATKKMYPIGHAQVGLGYLNLYNATGDKNYLDRALKLVDPLLQMASPRAKDLGWGMKHEWMTVQGLVPADTPCNTQTAYAYEFFVALYSITGNEAYLDLLHKIAKHVAQDFPEWRTGDMLVSSYSTIDERRVINANAYRMYMLIDAGLRFNNPVYTEKGIATLNYILSMQSEDGSWVYSEDQDFIDGFHTCFVLKNLFKVNQMLKNPSPAIARAIHSGLEYYCNHLIDKHGLPVPFSVKPRLVLYKYDVYDFAECISLFTLTGSRRKQLAGIVQFAERKFQQKEGWFLFRLFSFWKSKGVPYIRSANSAMFLALTELIKSEISRIDQPSAE